MTTAHHIDNTEDQINVSDLTERTEELRTIRDDYMQALEAMESAQANVAHHHGDVAFAVAILRDFPECAECRELTQNYHDTEVFDAEMCDELAELESLLNDLKGMGGDHQFEGDWYPASLIRDSYFKDYAQELAEDIGAIPADAKWPNNCIDWDQAARELQYDYSAVYIGDIAYWCR